MPGYDELAARSAVASSLSYSEALRKLGLRPAGGNHKLFRKYVDEVWKISTTHFDQDRVRTDRLTSPTPRPLSEVLVTGSSYNRHKLKLRLYEAGLKPRHCEMCGQDEVWRGARMSLIIDHINGIPDDNRLENLRILCPNCNATLRTHCGRKNQLLPTVRDCLFCGREFRPKYLAHSYCSRDCGSRHGNRPRSSRPETRKVEHPSYGRLIGDLSQMSMVKVGRKHGVSDNAVRKWLRRYEADLAERIATALVDGVPREIVA